jgi:hypothetical protein
MANITLPGTGQAVRTTEVAGEDIQHILITDSAGNIIGSTALTNGRGLNVIVLNESACKGVDAVNDDLTGALPLYMGGYGCTSLVNATPVIDNRMQAVKLTADGRQVIAPYTVPEDQLPTGPVTLTLTTNATLIAAGLADQKFALVGALIVNTSAVNTSILLTSGGTVGGTDGTVIGEIPVPAPANGVAPAAWPLPLRTTVGLACMARLRSAATSVIVTPIGYRTKG